MYSIDDLETFIAVSQRGGVSAAARLLGISPATASHRIGKLEGALKVTLFHRNSRNLRLTDEGQIFLERVQPVLADLRQAEQDAGGGMAQLRGHLRVTMSPWILSRFIMPHLAGFRRAHPELTVECLAVDRFVPLVEEGQDCAIRVGKLADSALIAQKLCDNQRIICAAPAYLEAAGHPQTVDDLRLADWVCLPWQTRFDLRAPDGRRRPVTVSRNFAVSNSDMLTDGAVQGLGLAVKSRLAVKSELDAGTLVEVMPGALAAPDAPISYVFAAGTRVGRKTRVFGQLVRRAFAGL